GLVRPSASRHSITASETSFAMSICRRWYAGQVCVAFWPVNRQNFTGHKINHGLGDIRRMIADSFDVLGDEKEMGAKADVAGILHHERQKIAEDRVMEQVELCVSVPNASCTFGVALRVSIEDVLEKDCRRF